MGTTLGYITLRNRTCLHDVLFVCKRLRTIAITIAIKISIAIAVEVSIILPISIVLHCCVFLSDKHVDDDVSFNNGRTTC